VTVVGGTIDEPLVLARRRMVVVASEEDEHTQPYHVAASMGLVRGRGVIERCAARAEELARTGLQRLAADVAPRRIASCAILTSKAREPLDLEKTLRSHALIHAAEGLLFREAIARAAVACGLEIEAIPEGEVLEVAAKTWGARPESIRKRLSDLRRTVGAPWTTDEKLATLAGLLALRTRSRRRTA
jgi:hypothetical protein